MKRRNRFILAIGFCILALAVCASAAAQNPNLAPRYGAITLRYGFMPDPVHVSLTAGGPIHTGLGGVSAHVANAPDFRVFYTAGSAPLTFWVESIADTTLLINLPDGRWVANDDSGSNLNPMIRVVNPASGRYDVFVGTFERRSAPAVLNITERW